MTHPHHPTPVVAMLGAIALALMASQPVAAQTVAAQVAVPVAVSWHALPSVVPEGASVVVKTRDGRATKGRVSSLSETAIVMDAGALKTLPADAVATIEGQKSRTVLRAAGRGAGVGLILAMCLIIGAGPQDSPCSTPEECNSRGTAVYGTALALPAVGAGIGAAVGALIPRKTTLYYRRTGSAGLSLAPVAGPGRRGGMVRVVF
jgi:hypothetical protein